MAKLIWERIGRRVSAEGSTTFYRSTGGYQIESRKRHIPHANGEGTWDHTTYFVLKNGKELAEKQSLRDAKEYAETLAD